MGNSTPPCLRAYLVFISLRDNTKHLLQRQLTCRYLLKKGADPKVLTPEGERPIDLCEPTDFDTIRVMLKAQGNRADKEDETESPPCSGDESK